MTETRDVSISEGLTGGGRLSLVYGTDSVPVTAKYPAIYVEKFCSNNQGPTALDQGAGVFKAIKKSGYSYQIGALTGEVIRDGGNGSIVGVTGWATQTATMVLGSAYGIWGVGYNPGAGSLGCYVHGSEFDGTDEGGDAGHWDVLGSEVNCVGSIGVWVNSMAGGNHCTVGVGVSYPNEATCKFHTGFHVNKDAIHEDAPQETAAAHWLREGGFGVAGAATGHSGISDQGVP